MRPAVDTFIGIYLPRREHDVFAAIGVVAFEVNFGGEEFRWKEGREWAWGVEGHVGVMALTLLCIDFVTYCWILDIWSQGYSSAASRTAKACLSTVIIAKSPVFAALVDP